MATQNKKGFTLVELIIVITILAILATIGFMSYQSYTKDAKDANRITSLKAIQDALTIQKTKKTIYPMPDSYLSIYGNGVITGYQGYVGTGVTQTIRGSEMKDPLDGTYYTYYLNTDKNKLQLAGFLENDPSKVAFINSSESINHANAVDYTSRFLYTVGDKVGVLLDATTNTPIQQVVNTTINLNTYTGSLDLYTTNTDLQTGTGGQILNVLNVIANPGAPCVFGISQIGSCSL
ncbi:MAG: type II secretion system protein [Candidatus Gracilibacteria bacterium]|nr:type II secretion system protein [Candidatus Gracilibacteria bacterium]